MSKNNTLLNMREKLFGKQDDMIQFLAESMFVGLKLYYDPYTTLAQLEPVAYHTTEQDYVAAGIIMAEKYPEYCRQWTALLGVPT